MKLMERIRWAIAVAAIVLLAALPAAGSAKANHGNHCGRGHAKHTKAIGKSCVKHNSHSTASTKTTAADRDDD